VGCVAAAAGGQCGGRAARAGQDRQLRRELGERARAGAIDITFGNKANGNLKGKILTLRPAVVDDAPVVPITWVCGMPRRRRR
jgi:hypothetical protein